MEEKQNRPTDSDSKLVDEVYKSKGSRLVQFAILVLLVLMITTVFVPVVFFGTKIFAGLIPFYTLVFLGIIVYAVIKRKLFNINIVTNEPIIIVLWLILVGLAIMSRNIDETLIQMLILAAVVLFGILLLWNARREVEQREKLSTLNASLATANLKLQNLDLARSEFIAMASHQLRTPPATIKWYLASILGGDYGQLDPQLRDAIIKAEMTNNSLIALSDELLNVSRIERGSLEFYFEETDMQELITKVMDQLQPLATLKRLEMSFVPPTKTIPVIMADKQKLRQVVTNLIDNAIKYTSKGQITVHLECDGEMITVQVKDTGRGISKDEAKTIFQKFSQGKDLLTRATGLGVGLFLAKMIITQHHGKIWAESPGVNQGSVFAFSIPVHSESSETAILDFNKT
jgi:signal transduction histidine kinase